MDNRIEEARKIVKSTFENPFDKDRFRYFAKNLLNRIDESPFVYRGNTVPHNYGSHIKTLERIGKYIDPEGNKIDILIVQLKKEKSLERARAMQRDLIARYLNGSRGGELKEAALVAFVAPDQDDWRFSLVKMDYKLVETPAGNIKAKEEFTPARRWSFLVGKNEKSHTAQSRLVDIFVDDVNDPSLAKLENAFDIEKVTKEFFGKYRNLYIRLTESLTAIVKEDSKIKKDFDEKSVEIPNFTKKLLGQIVFLYFLQKKGWFGVEKNSGWGTGPKDFLRLLFEKKITKYKNFFNDMLEPLFYEALAKERDKDFYSHFNCKIPFLNGGLFDPINDYDWVHTDINLPNELFSNENLTKEGDVGDGILDIFDRYNFTVKEDEPLEKEVAVDPEMLGKVFENLLVVKDRKSKGTYYTPREIVHYMCRESLINYLATEHSNLSLENIRNYVNYSDALSVDIKKLNKVWKGESFTQGQFRELDDLLKNIKIVDPACGSGAFLVGMLHEIVKLRLFLQLTPDSELFSKSPDSIKELSVYKLKEEIIQRCIYGVDIDPGAVEIAKLRLWLSLIVEEEDIRQIRPLPNLDYKIMQGNSLLEEFEGVKLFDEKLLKEQVKNSDDIERLKKMFEKQSEMERKLLPFYKQNPKWLTNKKIERPIELFKLEEEMKKIQYQKKHETEMTRLDAGKEMNGRLRFGDYSGRSEVIGEELKKLHDKFFKSSSGSEKNELKKEIEQLEWLLIEETLKEQNKKSALRKLEKYKKDKIKPFFLWKLNFGEVFQEKGGFDVVIANPPYISALDAKKKIDISIRDAYKNKFASAKGAYDLYVIFFDQGLSVLKPNGLLIYISPSKYLSAQYAIALRECILNYSLLKLADFSKIKIFESANVSTLATIIKNSKEIKPIETIKFDELSPSLLQTNVIKNNRAYLSLLPENVWGFLLSNHIDLIIKVFNYSDKLGDISEVNASSTAAEADEYSKYIVDQIGDNRLKIINTRTIDHLFNYWGKIEYKNNKRNILTPFLDLKKINKRRVAMYKTPKLIFSKVAKDLTAAYDKNGEFASTNTNFVYNPKKLTLSFLAAFLNSKFANFLYKNIFGGLNMFSSFQFQAPQIRILPIPKIVKNEKRFGLLVDKILAITKSDDYLENPEKQAEVKEYEKQIDQMVYKLYDLTEDEIKIVENS